MKLLTLLIAFIGLCLGQTDIYITSLAGNNVTVLNPNSFSVVAQIPVPNGPTGIVTTPAGEAWVASQGADVVSVINTSSKSIVATIRVCHNPTQVSLSASYAYLVVSCPGSNAVATIDTASKTLAAIIPVGNHPGHAGFMGDFAFVPNLWDNTVTVIYLPRRLVVNTFYADSGPIDMATTGGRVYILNQYSHTVSVHNPDGTRVGTISGFSSPTSLSIIGTTGSVTDGNSASFEMFDANSNRIISSTSVGFLPTYSARSADGTRAYITNQYGLSLSVVDTSNGQVIRTINRVCVYPAAVAVAYY